MTKISEYIAITSDTINRINTIADDIEQFAGMVEETLVNGKKVFFCGNGGSAADSQHLAAEFLGRFKMDRNPVPAIALTVDTSALTAIGNDYGFEYVFSRQLKGLAKEGDLLVGISTSGNSKNVIDAIRVAKNIGVKTVAMTGMGGGQLAYIADHVIYAPSTETNHIQECHITIGHLVCSIVEERLFG